MTIWLTIGVLLVCSGLVSGSETVLFCLSRKDLDHFRQAPAWIGRRPYLLMRHPRRVLMTVLIANTTVNVSIFSVSFGVLERFRVNQPALAAVVGTAVLISVILFGEMIPKAVGLANARRLAPAAAGLIGTLQTVLGPVRGILAVLLVDPITRLLAPSRRPSDTVSTEELRLLVEHSAREGHIDSTENEMLQSIVSLAEVSVCEVMTPRVDIEPIRIDDDVEAIRSVVRASRKRTLPVCGRDLDDIKGVIHARDVLLHTRTPITELVRPADFVPEQANLAQLVRHFRGGKRHFAIVVDEYGGTAGLVTNEDAVEWIVGELPKSQTPRPAASTERLDESTYRLSGDLSVREWGERFGVGEIDRHVNTVGGLILSKLGRIARRGDQVHIRNLTLTVESVKRRRIESVLLRRDESAETPEEATG